jgi:hypothetical protein
MIYTEPENTRFIRGMSDPEGLAAAFVMAAWGRWFLALRIARNLELKTELAKRQSHTIKKCGCCWDMNVSGTTCFPV